MSDNIIRFGILGSGVISNAHAEAIQRMDTAELVGVTSVDLPGAEKFAQTYAIHCYPDFESMLADERVDAVCICTPSGFHKENALQALRAKKHVVLEKPMAFTRAEAAEIQREAEKSGRVLTTICQLRFFPDVQKAKKIVEDGMLGKLVFCDLSMKYWRDPAYFAGSNWRGTRALDGGGALMNQGIHGVDLLLYMVGDGKVVYAKNCTRFHDIEVEDASVAVLEFENGAMGTIEASTCANPGFERRIEINGTRGAMVLVEGRIHKLIVDGEIRIDSDDAAAASTAGGNTVPAWEPYTWQLGNFIGAIHGEQKLLLTAAEGSRAVGIIEDIYRFGCERS
ncbi:MAG: Gfo/Idh/MocA family oxidoreductase [Oscillospiraceae bacterium]|nr:Gfo/Idh/MocA family oxidoreductase [Oscillospiraceae bacterium]